MLNVHSYRNTCINIGVFRLLIVKNASVWLIIPSPGLITHYSCINKDFFLLKDELLQCLHVLRFSFLEWM